MSAEPLLRAVLEETADLEIPVGYDPIGYAALLYGKLINLRTLARTIRDTGTDLAAVHPSRGISSLEGLRGDDDSQPARGEGPED